jgi:hypothetical protein
VRSQIEREPLKVRHRRDAGVAREPNHLNQITLDIVIRKRTLSGNLFAMALFPPVRNVPRPSWDFSPKPA